MGRIKFSNRNIQAFGNRVWPSDWPRGRQGRYQKAFSKEAPLSCHFTVVYRLRVAFNHHRRGIKNAGARTPRSGGPKTQKCTKGSQKAPASAQGALRHPPGATGLRSHWLVRIWEQGPRAAPALLAGSQQMALGLSLRFARPLSRRKRLPHWSEAARRGAKHGAAAAVEAEAAAAERRVGPRAVPRAGHRAPRPGGRPGTRAEAALARRGGDAGGPGGGAGEGEGEEEREKGKEESRAGPPLPSPARRRPETSRAAQPSPSASPTPKVRRLSRAARRPPGRSRGCSRLAFGPRSSEPSRWHVEAAAQPAQICNS